MSITYTGRLGTICNRVLTLFNDTQMQFVTAQTDLLTLVNLCQDDLAQSHFYRTEAALDVTSGESSIDLAEDLSDYEAIIGLHWTETRTPLAYVQRTRDLEALRLATAAERPLCYALNGNTLTLLPTPSATTEGGLSIHYYYRPGDLSGLTAAPATGDPEDPGGDPPYVPAVPDGTTPDRVPATHDDVFVYFVLWKLYQRDRHAPMAAQFARENMQLYERAKGRLLSRDREPSLRFKPYR